MKMSRKRILPKVWLSAIAICALFLGFAGSTVKASDNQSGGYFGLTSVSQYIYEAFANTFLVSTFQFQTATYSVNEPAQPAAPAGPATTVLQVTVTRTGSPGDPNVPDTVQFSTNDGNATGGTSCTAGVDYIITNTTLTFQTNDTQQTIGIPICSDGVFEGPESFNAILSNPSGTAQVGSPSNTVITINDADQANPGTFGFTPIGGGAQNVNVAENTPGTVTLGVNRSGGSAGTVTVTYTITNGTAVGGTACNGTGSVDFVPPATNTLTFVAGDVFEPIVIQICDDPVFENNEMFTVTITSVSSGTISPTPDNLRTVTIVDNETPNPGTIQFGAATYSANEGVGPAGGANVANAGSTTIQIPVIRSGGTDGAVTATVTFNDGSATGGGSCTANAQTTDFVNPTGNSDFIVNFPSGNGAATQTQFVNITICNNDFNSTGAAVPDAFQEQFSITLSTVAPTGGAVIGAQSTATISIFDDATGTIQFAPTTYTPTELTGTAGQFSIVPLTLTRNFSENTATTTVVVNYAFGPGLGTVAGGTAAVGGASCTTGVDYINTPGSVTFAPNVTQVQLNVSICADANFELNEDFSVTLTPTGNAVIVFPTPVVTGGVQSPAPPPNPASALVTIVNDDTANAGQISLADTTFAASNTLNVNENGNTVVPIQLVRTFSDEAATVTITVTSGTGLNGATGGASCSTAGVDFVFPSANGTTVTIPAGQTTFTAPSTFNIVICDDAIFENNETFNVTISNATSASGTAQVNPTFATRVVTIIDNDAQPGSLNISAPTRINESGGVGQPTNQNPVSSTYVITVSRPAGQTNGLVSATYTITNGGGANPAAIGSQTTGATVCGDAVTDYLNPGPTTITIPDQQASATITVTICNNDQNDTAPNENLLEDFTVTLTNPTGGATLGANSSRVFTIQDDARGTFQITAPTPASFSEGIGTQTITVTRVGGSAGTATINYTLSGTATGATGDCTPGNGLDYTFLAGNNTLTFGPGVTSASFNITICDDTLIEGNETIVVTLTSASNGELIGTSSPFNSQAVTFTILDNEAAATFAVSAPQGTAANEGSNGGLTPFVFTVTPSLANSQAQTVNFTATGSGTNPATGGATCTGNVDFINTGGSFTIPANSAAAVTFTVNVCADSIAEPNETFTVTLTGTNIPANTTATATIINDDGQQGAIGFGNVSAAGSVARVVEGNLANQQTTSTVTLTLTGNTTTQASTVQFAFANGTAIGGATCAAGVDFINTGGTATFAANTSTTTVTVTICGDTLKEANETFFVNLSGANNATIGVNQGVVIIVDDDRAIRADFDRDRRTDFSVFRPSTGQFFILQSINGLFQSESIGAQSGDIPVPGDYDNDGAADLAFFRPSNGTFNIRSSITNVTTAIQFGTNGDIPVQGDYDGDGDTDLAVFRPSSGTFFIANTLTNPNQNFIGIQFGQNGDIPVPADYDGDGRTDAAVFRPSGAIASNANASAFFVRPSSGATPFGIQFGATGDIPATGDFDGDGKADFTVFRTTASGLPSGISGAFFTFQSLTQTTRVVPSFGQAGDIPAIGDYDADGTDDIAVYRPNFPAAGQGAFLFVRSSNNTAGGQQFGATGDIPLPTRYQPTSATATP